MIISQKYNSINDVDLEFIPSLEELLASYIPSFTYLKQYEKNASPEIFFSYYLFFGHETNAPIGFAMLEIEQVKTQTQSGFESFLSRNKITKNNQTESIITWGLPGNLKEGIIFSPRFSKYAAIEAEKIFKEYFLRDDIQAQELYFSTAYEEVVGRLGDTYTKKRSELKTDSLIKNRASYAEFIQSLKPETFKTIRNAWKFVQQELQFEMGEYSSFKEVFQYKKNGTLQYKGLKTHPQLAGHIKDGQNIEFATLETSEEVKCIVLYMKGSLGHSFYDVFMIDETIPEVIPHQQAIMKFFEDEAAQSLHFIGSDSISHHQLELGYTHKKQIYLQATKSSH